MNLALLGEGRGRGTNQGIFQEALCDAHSLHPERGPREKGWFGLSVPCLPKNEDRHLYFFKSDQGHLPSCGRLGLTVQDPHLFLD